MASFPPIESVSRALRVLRAMNGRAVTRVNDLHHELGLPRPSIVRLLQSLEHAGYVARAPRRGDYMLTSRVLELSSGLHGLPAIVETLAPKLDELTALIKWPTAIAVPDGAAVRVAYSTIPSSPLSLLQSTMGMRLSLVSRALGRAYLAFCDDDVRQALLASCRVSPDPEDLPARNAAAVSQMIGDVRSNGYALRAPGVRTVSLTLAVPVLDAEGHAVASLGVTWFASTMGNQAGVQRHLDQLREIAGGFAGQSDFAG